MLLFLHFAIYSSIRAVAPGTDPDPAFQANPDPDPIRIQGFDYQKLNLKNTAEHFLIFYENLQFTFVQVTREASALKREHPALQKMNTHGKI
jgi:hypothetical protein